MAKKKDQASAADMLKEQQEKNEMTQEEIQEAIRKLDLKAGDEARDAMTELMERAIEAKMVPKAALGLSDEMMEAIYAHAYNLYNQGMYTEASYMFRVLVMLNVSELKYTMGLAASLHMLEEYEHAIKVYTMYGMLTENDPMPWYHASDCYMKLNNVLAAKMLLIEAEAECGEEEQYKVLKERIKMMIESIEDEAQEQFNELAEERAKVIEMEEGLEADAKQQKTKSKKLKRKKE